DEIKIGLNAKHNIAILTRRKRNTSILTTKQKLLFKKPLEFRTVKDRKEIVEIVVNLKCFEIFPPNVRARISKYLDFISIQSNHDIIHEGHTPLYVYFILNGEIIAHQLMEDECTKKMVRKNKFLVTSGDIIGHISLCHNTKRTHTYTARTDVECLYIDADIFNEHLIIYIKKNIESKFLALNQYDVFNEFTLEQRNFIALFGKLKEYKQMETIYHKDRGLLNYVYFVISGECMILQHLKVDVRRTNANKKVYTLSNQSTKDQINENDEMKRETIALLQNIKKYRSTIHTPDDLFTIGFDKNRLKNQKSDKEDYFIDVGTFSYGAIFGLGEPMNDRAIMARTTVQCLLIPRFWIFSKEQNQGNIWQKYFVSLNILVPTREQLFNYFVNDMKWRKFKKDYITGKLNRLSKSNSTKIDDIPLIGRIIELNYEDDLK
ncbi:uncharacterized protein LOC129614406, partial [Condylostylus longicornis]|uniref:uncharacterized protein LOC129614406 n=1 Tax=Condylostylus longicornis TaxID=2530218 RepID=UPI00244E36B5